MQWSDLLRFRVAETEGTVATLTIRDIDPVIKARFRLRAAQHGRSMGVEVREILRSMLGAPELEDNLAEIIRARFAPLGGVELELPQREVARDSPDFI